MDDAISRTQALQELDKIENKDCWYRLTDVMKMLNRLPSIQPEQKTGITIPDNATNGSAICYLYPDLKYSIHNGRVMTTIGVAASFDEEWWNAPYKIISEG